MKGNYLLKRKKNLDSIEVLIFLAIFILLIIMPQYFLWSHITDDAYISFRYIERLSSGQGLTFNPGERVEGFSNPLWVLLIAAIKAIFVSALDIPDIARMLGLLFSCLTLIMVWSIVKKLPLEVDKEGVFIVVAFLLIATPGFHIYSTSGLEVPLLSFLLLAGINSTLQRGEFWRYLAALLFGLAGIVRPEAPLYGILWYVFTFKLEYIKSTNIKVNIIRLAIFLIPIITYQVFRLIYFGELLPNTAIAKPSGVFGGVFGITYIWPWILSLGGPLIIILLLFNHFYSNKEQKSVLLLFLGPIIGSIVFVIYAQDDWMPFGRFIVPTWPVTLICFSIYLNWFIEDLNVLYKWKDKALILLLVILTLIFTTFTAWGTQIISYMLNEEYSMLMRGTDQVIVGKWLSDNVEPGATVATVRLGGISYIASELIIYDLLGLTDKEQAYYIRSKGLSDFYFNSPILKRSPDFIAAVEITADQSYKNDKQFMEFLNEKYMFVMMFKQGNYGTVNIYVLQESKNKLAIKSP